MRCAAAAGAAEMRSAPSIPASARSIDQLWQEMTDPPAAFPCLRARCAVHKALHCTSLHATTVHGSSRRRLPLGLCLLPYPLLVDVGRLSLSSASMHARWLHGEAAKELYPPLLLLFLLLSQILPLQMAAVRRWPSAVQTAAPAAHGRTPLRSKNAR